MSGSAKSRYTPAQKKAVEKYMSEKVENMQIRVPKGRKAVIQAHAAKQGESMNAFVLRAVDETMENDNREGSRTEG